MKNKKSTEDYINEVKKIHGDKYDYSKIIYINNHTNVCVICFKHGEFNIRPDHLKNGSGCKECFKEEQSKRHLLTNEQFIQKAKEIHNNKYDYSVTNYRGHRYGVDLICPIHGKFTQNAGDHLRGCGCKECGKVIMWDNRGRINTEDFIKKAREVHGTKYTYDKVEYVNAKTPVTITCKKHGDFSQTPSNHILGCGCSKCAKSKMVNEIIKHLSKRNINYNLEETFNWLAINGNKLRIDIFLPDYNIGIECQGLQHFQPIEYWGGEKTFEKTKLYDEIKLKLCTDNGIKLVYYTNLKKIIWDKPIYTEITDLLNALKNE